MMLGANMGVVGMAKEHLGVALALKVGTRADRHDAPATCLGLA